MESSEVKEDKMEDVDGEDDDDEDESAQKVKRSALRKERKKQKKHQQIGQLESKDEMEIEQENETLPLRILRGKLSKEKSKKEKIKPQLIGHQLITKASKKKHAKADEYLERLKQKQNGGMSLIWIKMNQIHSFFLHLSTTLSIWLRSFQSRRDDQFWEIDVYIMIKFQWSLWWNWTSKVERSKVVMVDVFYSIKASHSRHSFH